jgi:hypothetical protein
LVIPSNCSYPRARGRKIVKFLINPGKTNKTLSQKPNKKQKGWWYSLRSRVLAEQVGGIEFNPGIEIKEGGHRFFIY